MEALSLNSISTIGKRVLKLSDKPGWRSMKQSISGNMVECQSGGNAIRSSGPSSLMTERPHKIVVNSENGKALMDTGSLVLTPNGKSQAAIVKDLVPYGKPSNPMLEIDDDHNNDGIGIIRFLQGKALLVTGGTGFLGKVLIEKILRVAPEVNKIYILIKAKSKENATERLKNEIISAELFKGLKQTYGNHYQAFVLSKLVAVVGNICEPNLGLEDDIADLIANEVDIIVNSAANTTFDERYDVALDINTGGPTRLMNFAKQCHKLKLFLQISTAYVNGRRRGRIAEKPFQIGDNITKERLILGDQGNSPPVLNIEEEMKLVLDSKQGLQEDISAQKMKELGLERATKFGWQDTYVFTKAMGEMMIENLKGSIPVVIIRPSVIESTLKEPFPGWMEGNRMMDPILLSYGKGQLTGFLVDPNGVLDVVPADMVVNATLAAMAKHGAASKSGSYIYQIASSVVNPLVFRDLAKMFYEHFYDAPWIDTKGRQIHVPRLKLFSSMEDFSSHLWQDAINRSGLTTLPDINGKLSKKLENFCRKSVEQAKYLARIYKPYTFYRGRFDNNNIQRLMELMSEEEKKQFEFDVESIDWKDYISNIHIPGLRTHVMKGRGLCS